MVRFLKQKSCPVGGLTMSERCQNQTLLIGRVRSKPVGYDLAAKADCFRRLAALKLFNESLTWKANYKDFRSGVRSRP